MPLAAHRPGLTVMLLGWGRRDERHGPVGNHSRLNGVSIQHR